MKKESLAISILRVVLVGVTCAFAGMLYWSSLSIEEKAQEIKEALADLKNEVVHVDEQIGRILQKLVEYPSAGGVPSLTSTAKSRPGIDSEASRSRRTKQMDDTLPNLLREDPFYADTLPNLLGSAFRPQGIFRDATIGKPNDLHPFSNWSQIAGWIGMCNVSLARMEFGKYETFSPNMAIKIEERKRGDRKAPEYWVHLREGVYWQPLSEKMFGGKVKLAPHFLKKHPVTAEDFKFYFDAVMNPHVQQPGAVALRNYIGDIEEVQVVDELTLVVRWKVHEVADQEGQLVPRIRYIAKMWTGALSPLPRFVYQYFADGSKILENDSPPDTYRTNSVWAQNFMDHWAKNVIVSCGPWIFEEMTDRQISFKRNPDHFFPLDALEEGMAFEFKNSPDTIWQEFKSNRLDIYTLRPDQLVDLKNFLDSELYQQQAKAGQSIQKIEYTQRAYSYIGWNMAKPLFKSKTVRQAMTMAINRKRIIQQYLNGLGVELTGPFTPFSPSYDQTIEPWPYDPETAKKMLEEEGWVDSDGDGILDKEFSGKRIPFEFRLTYFVKNPTTKAICEYVATALKEIGVRCLLNGVDLTDLSAVFDDKGFDALCMGWGLATPPEDPRQLWYSAGAKEPGSSNAVGFANPEADAIIHQLEFEQDSEARIHSYHRFHRIIHEEQPYTFLYVPKTILLYREHVQNVFIPAMRQDLVPGADVSEPISSVFWLKKNRS